mgnify:CR=1 FL=1
MQMPKALAASLILCAGTNVAAELPINLKESNQLVPKHAKPVAPHVHHGLEHNRHTSSQNFLNKVPQNLPYADYQKQQLAKQKHEEEVVTAKKAEPSKTHKLSQSFWLNEVKTDAVIQSQCTDPNELMGLSGQVLVDTIKGAELRSCMYGLYNASLVGSGVFSDQNLISIVNAINEQLVNYDAISSVETSELENLVTYLRAMHWAESSAGSNRVFQSEYLTALEQAFGTYFNGAHFAQFNGAVSRDFMVRYEMLVLLNSSNTDRQPYLHLISNALLGYANSVSKSNDWGEYYEEQGVTRLLTHLFEATTYQSEETAITLAAQPNIVNDLIRIVTNDGLWLVGHTREYQWADTVNELGRLLSYGGEVAQQVRPTIQQILSTYSYEGDGANGWINAQASVTAFDSENCDLYGDACAFDLENAILAGRHVCSETLKVRYQGVLSEENLSQICSSLAAQEQEFHQVFGTNRETPVMNDQNEDLEVVIFDSSTSYENYAGRFFGINTDNGGMYLEGTPSDSNNQARFIAFQATWLQPEFVVWNLDHEYIHYLDGRYNQWGSFNDQPANSVWWGEGIAEYLSKGDENANALAAAAQNTYSLSELFDTTYANSNTARTYYWGYLAVRFMFERRSTEITNELLPSMRAPKRHIATGECSFDWSWRTKDEAIENNWYWAYDDSEWATGSWVWTCGQPQQEFGELPVYTPYQDILDGWNTRFDVEFSDWLVCLVAGEGRCHETEENSADLNRDGAVDMRDLVAFIGMLRSSQSLDISLDFNEDGQVNRRDVRALAGQCDLARCAISN